MKIRIIGKAGDHSKEYLYLYDGIDCQEDFTAYFGTEQQPLIDKDVVSGYMSFEVIDGELYTITEYECKELLTDSEIQLLIDYTQGQWSDGIGEGFEQQPCVYVDDDWCDCELYVSPWYHGQEVTYQWI